MNKRVLLVDDAPFILEILRNALEKEGYHVVPDAMTGTEAISHAEEFSPDLILMDLAIPEINGLEAAKEILELNTSVQIVAMSSLDQPEMVMKALEVGCVDFLAKPFSYEDLLAMIARATRDIKKGEAVNG